MRATGQQLFTENTVDMTAPSSPDMPGYLCAAFKVGGFNTQTMLGLNSGSMDGMGGQSVSTFDTHNAKTAEKQRKEQQGKVQIETTTFMLLLNQISQSLAKMEGDLADRYGEDFAENLLADLVEQGLIDADAAAEIQALTDMAEKRQAVAALIQKGLDEGTISLDDLAEHPWAEEWLNTHRERDAELTRVAEAYLDGKLKPEEATEEVLVRAGRTANENPGGSLSTVENAHREATVRESGKLETAQTSAEISQASLDF